jgi:integrase
LNRPRRNDRHLPPCVHFKNGAYYYVKRNKWTWLGRTLSAALEAYAKIVETVSAPGKMPELIDRVYDYHVKKEKLAKNTREQYRYAADVLKGIFRNADPNSVKSKHIAQVKVKFADTPSMANRYLTFLSIVFGYAVEWGESDSNPCAGVKRHDPDSRDRLISDEEWRAIYDAAQPRLRVIMELQLLTGQRIGDVLSIRLNQLTDHGILFGQQKTGAKVLVRWTRQLRNAVEAAKALSADMPPALTLLRGRRNAAPQYKNVYRQWVQACKVAGVEDARPNDGRAKSATTARAQDKDATALLGHKSAAMTDRYLRDRSPTQADAPNIRRALDAGQKRKSNQ